MMSLPDLLNTDGEWADVLDVLYDCFRSIFLANSRRLVEGRLLTFDGRRIDDDKEEGFWHVVSRDHDGRRIPDFERARRMAWIPAMLDGTAQGLQRWKYIEGSGRTRQYYWLQQESYVLILEEQRKVTVLITAFFVDKFRTVDDLTSKRDKGNAF